MAEEVTAVEAPRSLNEKTGWQVLRLRQRTVFCPASERFGRIEWRLDRHVVDPGPQDALQIVVHGPVWHSRFRKVTRRPDPEATRSDCYKQGGAGISVS